MRLFGSASVTNEIAVLERVPGIRKRTTKRWYGLNRQAIERVAELLGPANVRVDYNAVPPWCETVQDWDPALGPDNPPTNAPLESTWELNTNKFQYSLWRHPKVVAALAELAGEPWNIPPASFRAALSAALSGNPQPYIDLTGKVTTNFPADILALIDHLLQDDDTFQLTRFVLTNTQRWAWLRSAADKWPTFLANLDTLWTSQQILADYHDCPIQLDAGLTWLFQGPRILQQQDGTFLIILEWWQDWNDPWKYVAMQ